MIENNHYELERANQLNYHLIENLYLMLKWNDITSCRSGYLRYPIGFEGTQFITSTRTSFKLENENIYVTFKQCYINDKRLIFSSGVPLVYITLYVYYPTRKRSFSWVPVGHSNLLRKFGMRASATSVPSFDMHYPNNVCCCTLCAPTPLGSSAPV